MNKTNSFAHPLQSPYWGSFRKAWGNEVIELNSWLITLHKIPFTPYKIGMFIKGPEPTQAMLDQLKQLAKENNLIFIKLEPNCARQTLGEKRYQADIRLLQKNGAVAGKTLFTPTSFWVDLTQSEGELIKSFHHKTRYNIKLALKHLVQVKEDNSKKAFKRYLELTQETVERQGFYAHTRKYHELMWEYLHQKPVAEGNEPVARLLTATYQKEIITTWILFVWGNFLYYPYGASTDRHKFTMANNLMLWEAIRLGKSLGLTTFDLWGREEGKGFTKFKEGYNPQVVEFLGTWDLVTNPFVYYLYRAAEGLRWLGLRMLAKFGLSKYRF